MTVQSTTIQAGKSLSGAVSVSTADVVALITPPNWPNGVNISFQVSADNVEFSDLAKPDTVPCTAKQWIPIAGVANIPKNSYFKIRAGHPSAPVNQKADQVFKVVLV